MATELLVSALTLFVIAQSVTTLQGRDADNVKKLADIL